MTSTISLGACVIVAALLAAAPASSCHRYRYWHFRHPQSCGVIHAARRVRIARIAEREELSPADAKRPDIPTPPPAPPRLPPSDPPPPAQDNERARDPAVELLIKAMQK